MKIKLYTFVALVAGISLIACEKNQQLLDDQNLKPNAPVSTKKADNSISPDKVIVPGESPCPVTVTQLTAGQFINAGSVTVTNDENYIYVMYTTANGYVLTQTHLYVGNCANIPLNNQGNPVPGRFPYKATHANLTTYTYQVPISAISAGSCGCIAAHAAVVKLDEAGNIVDSQTAWGSGYRINPQGNWGMAFGYCSCAPGL